MESRLPLPEVEPDWTRRQREVLDLLVAGRTNRQIGEALGIGLEGAKWHVSEILSKLGVEQREEAAEYWRHRNGLRTRFLRVARGGGGIGAWKLVAAGTTAVLAVAGSAIVVALLVGSDPETAPAGPVSPSPETPAAATQKSAPTVIIDGTPTGTPTHMALRTGMQGLIGYDSVAYFLVTCSGCGGQLNLLRGHYEDGQFATTELLPGATGRPIESFYTHTADFDRGLILVGSCTVGFCGQEGGPSADAENVVLRSSDGGITWEEAGSLPRGAVFVGITRDGRVVARDAPASFGHFVFPSGVRMPNPQDAPESYAFVDASGAVVWRSRDGTRLFTEIGNPIVLNIPAGSTAMVFDRSGSGDLWAGWTEPGAGDGQFARFDVRPDGTWTPVETWTSPGFSVSPLHLLPGLHSIAAVARYEGNVCAYPDCSPPGRQGVQVEGAIVRLDSGTVHAIPWLSEGLTGNAHPFLRHITTNFPYLTVSTEGCEPLLHVAAGGSAVTCVADGVLVRANGAAESANGETWTPVRLFDGREGWLRETRIIRQQ